MRNQINIISKRKAPGLLPMGGKDRDGNLYQVDNISLLKNGKRILPVMGEFHYSRYEPESWEEELQKMKAGGITIVATYIFWIHHEEKEGEWDFTGCRNLRHFLELCQKTGLQAWLRIGPWAHGECRNGGFPDWIAHMDKEKVRVNEPEYLGYVEKYFGKLGEQCRGMMCKDGGPVIGVQLENEYGHCGGPADAEKGLSHMKQLKKMAIAAGFEVPYYSATGWGSYVAEDETLPMLGGYVDAPWATHTKELPAGSSFLFESYKIDDNIGSDRKSHEGRRTTYDVYRYPWLTAELGAGIQPTSHRRPYPWPEDTEAQALCILGSGGNLPGYYMYHGGINPEGKYSTLQESQATDVYNNLPIKCYDFQTCIRESGELNESFGRLKKMHFLMEDYGEILAGAEVHFPEVQPESPEDMHTLRAAMRMNHAARTGFLFLNNHQRRRKMEPHQDFSVELVTEEGTVTIPHLSLKTGECAVIPFGLSVGERKLELTNASLLCRIGERVFFYTDLEKPLFQWKGEAGNIVVLTTQEANHAFRVADALYITEHGDSCLIEADGGKYLLTKAVEEKLTIYRETGEAESISVSVQEPVRPEAKSLFLREEKDENGKLLWREYRLTMEEFRKDAVHQLYASIDYLGDRAEVYQNGALVDDWFTNGERWHVGLRRFGYPEELIIRIYASDNPLPCSYGTEVYYDLPVEKGCELRDVELLPEYRIELK